MNTYQKLFICLGAFILTAGTVFSQATISIGSGATITIAPGATVVGDALVMNSGTLNIQSVDTASGSLIVASAIASGSPSVNVERYLPSTNWHIVSSAAQFLPLLDFAELPGNSLSTKDAGATYALAPYDETLDTWDPYTTSSTTENFGLATGYVTKRSAPGTVTFKGRALFAGEYIVDIDSTKWGWNAIGNPYTSSMIAKGASGFLGINAAAIHDSYEGLYVWDQTDYKVIADGGITWPDGPAGGEAELNQDTIAMGQGFIVRSVAGGSTVTFNHGMQFAKTDAAFKSAEEPEPAVRLTASAGELVNKTTVAFNAEKTMGLDPGYDVGKLKGNAEIALYTQLADKSSEVDFALQTLPNKEYESLSIPVGFDFPGSGEVAFSLEYINLPYYAEVYIEDLHTNTFTQLNKQDAVYKVQIANTSGYGRFNLVFNNFSETVVSVQENLEQANNVKVFVSQGKIIVDGPADDNTLLSVYSIDGKKWYQGKAEYQNRNEIKTTGFATGVYLIKVEKSLGTSVHKVILTNQ